MAKKVMPVGRRKFVRGISRASTGDTVASTAVTGLEQPVSAWAGAILHASEGQLIPDTPDGRQITIKVDSQLTPNVQMSMIAEDLPPNSEVRVHLHQHEDEIIFIRMGLALRRLATAKSRLGRGPVSTFRKGCGTACEITAR